MPISRPGASRLFPKTRWDKRRSEAHGDNEPHSPERIVPRTKPRIGSRRGTGFGLGWMSGSLSVTMAVMVARIVIIIIVQRLDNAEKTVTFIVRTRAEIEVSRNT